MADNNVPRLCRLQNAWYDIFVNYNWVVIRWQWYNTHLHTNSTWNNTNNNRTIQITTNYTNNNLEECGPCPVFASFTLAFALQLRKKHGKTSVRVKTWALEWGTWTGKETGVGEVKCRGNCENFSLGTRIQFRELIEIYDTLHVIGNNTENQNYSDEVSDPHFPLYLHVMCFVKRIHSRCKRRNKKCFLFLFHKKG